MTPFTPGWVGEDKKFLRTDTAVPQKPLYVSRAKKIQLRSYYVIIRNFHLPTTEEVTEETSTNETKKWVNDSCDRTTRIDTKAAMNMKPPDYDQSIEPRQNMIQGNPQMLHNQHLSYGAHQPVPLAFNMQYNGPPATVPGHYQAQATGNSGVPSREETVEEKRERKKQQLIRRKVPADL